jgi:hypothetical protein
MSTHGSDGLIGSLGYASTAPQPADGFVDFDEIFSFPGWSSRLTFLLLLDSFMTFPLRLLFVLLTPSTRATRRRLVVHGAWRGGPARQEFVVARRSCGVPGFRRDLGLQLGSYACVRALLKIVRVTTVHVTCAKRLSRCCGVETMLRDNNKASRLLVIDLSPGTTTHRMPFSLHQATNYKRLLVVDPSRCSSSKTSRDVSPRMDLGRPGPGQAWIKTSTAAQIPPHVSPTFRRAKGGNYTDLKMGVGFPLSIG